MWRVAQRFYDDEIRPALVDHSPSLGLTTLLGTALLLNKRYLADQGIVPLPEVRWQCLAAWLAATLVLLACLRHSDRKTGRALLGTLLGVVALAMVMSVGLGRPGRPLHLRWPFLAEPFLMMTMAWLVAAPALAAAIEPRRRARTARAAAMALLFATALVLSQRGPARALVLDHRYDSFHWGLLTFCWLGLMALLSSAGVSARTFADDGGGLGRWRFWLPWVAVFLVVMVVIVAGFAGRQPRFQDCYPLFRTEWRDYSPRLHGWRFFALYEVTYLLYFVAWEYFFRGWMLFRLERDYGARAILIQTVPFVLMHIGKPPLEFHSSLIAGVVLGWLAWRSRSFWPCVILHSGVAFTMDLTALLSRMYSGH